MSVQPGRAPDLRQAADYVSRIQRARALGRDARPRVTITGQAVLAIAALFAGTGVLMGAAAVSLVLAPSAPTSCAIRVLAATILAGG